MRIQNDSTKQPPVIWRHVNPLAGWFEYCLMCGTKNSEDNYKENIRSSQEHKKQIPFIIFQHDGKYFTFIFSLCPHDSNMVGAIITFHLQIKKLGFREVKWLLQSLMTNKRPGTPGSKTWFFFNHYAIGYLLIYLFWVEGYLEVEFFSEKQSTNFLF